MGSDFPGGPVVKNPPSNAGDEVWCLVKKLRSHMPAWLLKSLQSCTILFDPLDCSLPFFSVHGVLTARLLEWVAMPFCRGSSWPRDRTHVSCVSCTADGSFTSEPPGRPQGSTHCRATEPTCAATIEPAYFTAQEPQPEKIHELQWRPNTAKIKK